MWDEHLGVDCSTLKKKMARDVEQERVQPSCLRDVRVVMARTKGCTLKGDGIQRKSLLRVAGENAAPIITNKHGNEDLTRAC